MQQGEDQMIVMTTPIIATSLLPWVDRGVSFQWLSKFGIHGSFCMSTTHDQPMTFGKICAKYHWVITLLVIQRTGYTGMGVQTDHS